MHSSAPAQARAPINSPFLQSICQRPTRRVQSARDGRGGRWPWPLGTRLVPDPAGGRWQRRQPLPWSGRRSLKHPCAMSGRDQETHAFPRPGAGRGPGQQSVHPSQRPAPDPAGAKRPPGAGWALAVALEATAGAGPIRREVAEASASAMREGVGMRHRLRHVRAGGNASRFPPPVRAGAPHIGASMQTRGRRPTRRVRSARHGWGGRWPWPLGPRPVLDDLAGTGRGVSLCHGEGVGMKHCRAGFGRDQETQAFPRPGAGRGPDQQSVPATQRPAPAPAGAERPAQGRGGRWPWPSGPRPVPDLLLTGGRGVSLCHGRGGVL
jgi:hypothetical protein